MEKPQRQSAKRDLSRKRQSILDAAILEFREKGFDNTSMDRIAELAGASKRTVYNHFPNKQGLFEAVIEQYGTAMHALKLIRYDAGRSLEAQLSDFADAELAIAGDPTWSGFTRVLLSVFLLHPELARQTMTQQAGNENALATWVQAAVAAGKLRSDNPILTARVFSAMIGGAFTWPAMYQGGLDPATIQALKNELIATFLCRYQKENSGN